MKKKPAARQLPARKIKYLAIVLALGMGAWFFVRDHSLRNVRSWADMLLSNLRGGNQGDHVLVRINQRPVWHLTFPDGTWCLAVMQSKAAGDAEDWGLLVHSSREESFTSRIFPDIKAFHEALGSLPTQSWTAFSAAAQAQLGFQPLPR